MDTQNVVPTINGKLFSHKNIASSDTSCDTDEPWKCAQWNKPAIKDKYCIFPLIWDILTL